jgi:hypothetical protein
MAAVILSNACAMDYVTCNVGTPELDEKGRPWHWKIAQRQGSKLERDACGRPFVQAAAHPLAEAPTAPAEERGRFEWLIRVIRALTARPPSPGGIHRRGVPR